MREKLSDLALWLIGFVVILSLIYEQNQQHNFNEEVLRSVNLQVENSELQGQINMQLRQRIEELERTRKE